ncbi:hypothetical protein CISIN_1g0386052mg, partial [Citrus sinensis]
MGFCFRRTSDNFLTFQLGEIPREFGNLADLEQMSLWENNLR